MSSQPANRAVYLYSGDLLLNSHILCIIINNRIKIIGPNSLLIHTGMILYLTDVSQVPSILSMSRKLAFSLKVSEMLRNFFRKIKNKDWVNLMYNYLLAFVCRVLCGVMPLITGDLILILVLIFQLIYWQILLLTKFR